MAYFLLRRYYAVAISGNGTGLIPGHCAAVGFFFLLLINSWCAVSNYHSRKLDFMLLSAQLYLCLVNGGLTGCGLYSRFKKEKKVFPQ